MKTWAFKTGILRSINDETKIQSSQKRNFSNVWGFFPLLRRFFKRFYLHFTWYFLFNFLNPWNFSLSSWKLLIKDRETLGVKVLLFAVILEVWKVILRLKHWIYHFHGNIFLNFYFEVWFGPTHHTKLIWYRILLNGSFGGKWSLNQSLGSNQSPFSVS